VGKGYTDQRDAGPYLRERSSRAVGGGKETIRVRGRVRERRDREAKRPGER
jgi:hypothetical protein